MVNNWLTVEESAELSGKSPHTIRKILKKPGIITKTIDRKINILRSSLVRHYGLTDSKKTVNQIKDTNNDINNNINQNQIITLAEHKIEVNKIKERLLDEKNNILDKMTELKMENLKNLNGFDKIIQEKNNNIEKIRSEKNAEIEKIRSEKNAEIEKNTKAAGKFKFYSAVSTIFLAIAVSYMIIRYNSIIL